MQEITPPNRADLPLGEEPGHRDLTKMLSEGGLILFHDFTYPSNPILASAWEIYFKLLQRVGGRQYPEWRNVFYGLPELLRQTTWLRDLPVVLEEKGFTAIEVEHLTLGASALVTAIRSGPFATAADTCPAGSLPG